MRIHFRFFERARQIYICSVGQFKTNSQPLRLVKLESNIFGDKHELILNWIGFSIFCSSGLAKPARK